MSSTPRHSIPEEILALSHERDLLRKRGQYDRADVLKRRIEEAGYLVKDNPHGAHLVIMPSVEMDGEVYRTVRQLPSLLEETDTCTFSVNILARNSSEQTIRCIESVLRFAGDTSIEIVLVDNASLDDITARAETLKMQESRLRPMRATRPMGVAEARNIGLQQSRGQYILLLDNNVELTGDIFSPLAQTLAEREVGITGPHGFSTPDLRHFEALTESEEKEAGEVEAVDGQCMAFKRTLLKQAGMLDERYRYPYYMDIDFSFSLRDQGVQAILTPDLPLKLHPPVLDASIPEAEQARLTKRNFYRFLAKWGDRDDLLLTADEEGEEEE